MTRQMVVDQLIETAQRATGLDRFDSDSYREGLDVLVRDANREDRPDDMVDRFEQAIVKSLSDRLKTTDYLAGRTQRFNLPTRMLPEIGSSATLRMPGRRCSARPTPASSRKCTSARQTRS